MFSEQTLLVPSQEAREAAAEWGQRHNGITLRGAARVRAGKEDAWSLVQAFAVFEQNILAKSGGAA